MTSSAALDTKHPYPISPARNSLVSPAAATLPQQIPPPNTIIETPDATAPGESSREDKDAAARQTSCFEPLAQEDGLWPGLLRSVDFAGSETAHGKPSLFFLAPSPTSEQVDGISPESNDSADVTREFAATSPFPFVARGQIGYSGRSLNPGETLPPPSTRHSETAAKNSLDPQTPRISKFSIADTLLWNGKHAEDCIDEEIVKNGYSEKAQVSNETNSAKSLLSPHLKNKTTLQNLSAFFVVLLKQRQDHGRVNATSTFKPPPRVTLTDTKREQWLRDLASATVPLRRLSRTIPHGIRGPSLLDQCLKKHIPVSRAIWLAKCVGANEMRAFRRKGINGALVVGNESKWIKEWTSFVEEFIEKTINTCGEPDWKQNMNYVIQLSTRLYSQRLLDSDHFLGWMLDFFQNCSTDRLPAAFLFIRIYWKDLTSNGIHGWRLTNAILEHLNRISSHVDADLFLPIIHRLRHLLRILANNSPNCLLVLKHWKKYRSLLLTARDEDATTISSNLGHMIQRNDRLIQKNIKFPNRSTSTVLPDDTVMVLDSLHTPYNLGELFSGPLSEDGDLHHLMVILLQWAASVYRNDPCRVYIASSLIQGLQLRGFDTDTAILEALGRLRGHPGVNAIAVSRVLVNLSRHGHFNAGTYLQWLIAVGALAGCDIHHLKTSCDVRPLVDIPLHNLPKNVINLRRTLLRSTTLHVENDTEIASKIKSTIADSIPEIFQQGVEDSKLPSRLSSVAMSELNMAVASDISAWIQQDLKAWIHQTQQPDGDDMSIAPSYSIFAKLRRIFESFQDIASLAEVSLIMAKSIDVELLVGLLDTLQFHFEIFSVLGIGSTLFTALVDSYRIFRKKRPPHKDLVARFIELCNRMSSDTQLVAQFQRELALCEHGSSLSACSPVSDGMIEDARESGADFADEIERLLTSGTSMDNHTFSTVFNLITTHFRLAKSSELDRIASLSSSMCRLKSFDEEFFDKLMSRWITETIVDGQQQVFKISAPILVGNGCWSISKILHVFDQHLSEDEAQVGKVAGIIAVRLVDFLTANDSDDSPYDTREQYRFKLEQENYINHHPRQMFKLFLKALRQASRSSETLVIANLQAAISQRPILDTIQDLARNDTEALFKELKDLFESNTVNGIALITPIVDSLVDPSGSLGIAKLSNEFKIDKLFSVVDAFSLPPCQTGLRSLVNMLEMATPDPLVTKMLLSAVQSSISRNCQYWPRLLSGLDRNTLQPVREYAEDHILQLCESYLQPDSESLQMPDPINLSNGLSIVGAAVASIPEAGIPRLAVALLMHLRTAAQRISQKVNSHAEVSTDGSSESATLDSIVTALLSLVMFHSASFQNTKSGSPDTIALLNVLSQLLLADKARPVHLTPIMTLSTHQYIFDVIAHFTSDLPESALTQLTRDLAPLSSDWRIRFLFGFSTSPDAWLCLSQPAPASPAQAVKPAAASPTPVAAATPSAISGARQISFPLRRWELFSDPAPNPGENDTALSLRLFDARKVI